jgi:hypothetical protein
VRHELASLKLKDRPLPPRRTPLQVIVARLRRLESRIKHITIVCDEHIDRHGGEPSTITRIHQIATGEYDT